MESYSFHFERMSNLDLHPLSLPVSRLPPVKSTSSSSSIDQFTSTSHPHQHPHHHHQHGKGDSAYSSFSGGSSAPDFPSAFLLPEDLQRYADLKDVKAGFQPPPEPPAKADSGSMEQLCRSVEALSRRYQRATDDREPPRYPEVLVAVELSVPPPLPPAPPARLDSFIATKNLENTRVHHQGSPPALIQGQNHHQTPKQNQPQPQNHHQTHKPKHTPNQHQSLHQTQSQTLSQAQSQPQYQTQSQPQYQTQSQPQHQTQSQPQYQTQSQPQHQTQSQPQLQNQTQPQHHHQHQTQIQPQHQTQSQPQYQPQNQPQNQAQHQTQSQPQLQHQPLTLCYPSPPQGPRPPPQGQTVNPDTGRSVLKAGPVHSGQSHGSQHHPSRQPLDLDHLVVTDNRASERQRSSTLSHPALGAPPEHPKPPGPATRNHGNRGRSADGRRQRAHSAQVGRPSEPVGPAGPGSPGSPPQSLYNSSIRHKGPFYFVTGVCKQPGPPAPACPLHTARDVAPGDGEARHGAGVSHGAPGVYRSVEPLDPIQGREVGCHHSSNHPIFYCGPEDQQGAPPLSAPPPSESHGPLGSSEQAGRPVREDQGNRGGSQPLGQLAKEKINKETTPMLYHLTGASRAALKHRNETAAVGVKAKEAAPSKGPPAAPSGTERVPQGEREREAPLSSPCNTLDDSFKKYYKERLKDAQSKVLRETSFKRKDLQLSWPYRLPQRAQPRPSVLPPVPCSSTSSSSFSSSSQSTCSETSTETLAPSVTGSEATETEKKEREKDRGRSLVVLPLDGEKEGGRPANVAQPQVARVGGRKRLTAGQKKMCYSEPEKLHQVGCAPAHSTCRSLGNEREALFFPVEGQGEELSEQGEQGLVAARRKMFESQGRALSQASLSKSSLKHLQYKALVAYMERKTGQKQQPGPQFPPDPSQRHSMAGKPGDWGPRPLSGNKCPVKKLHRPHSAGRVLDSPSSSIRYAQFSSGQSGWAQTRQRMWRESDGLSQAKSASMESLLEQTETDPDRVFRNRSTSTPHAFQVCYFEKDSYPAKAMDTLCLQRAEDRERVTEPAQARALPEGQRPPVRGATQRGKSMEELGSSRAGLSSSALSRSSEPLDPLRWSELTGREKGGGGAPLPSTTAPPPTPNQSQRKAQPWTERKPLLKRGSAPQLGSPAAIGPPSAGGTRDSSRSTSPASVSSSRVKAHSGPPWSGMPDPPVGEDMGTRGAPSSDPSDQAVGNQESSEKQIQALSPSLSYQAQAAAEHRKRGKTPPFTSSEREESVNEPLQAPPTDFLSCGVTNDPSLRTLPPEPGSKQEVPPPPQTEGQSEGLESINPAPALAESELRPGDERGSPEGQPENAGIMEWNEEPRWEELVEEVVAADQSLARALYPLANRKTALMLMEQLLSEDTLLMEEHYKQKQEKRPLADSEALSEVETSPSKALSGADADQHRPSAVLSKEEAIKKKRALVACIEERLRGVEVTRGALQADILENGYSGAAVESLVRERCLPVESERYSLFIGDLERVVNLLLCLSARLARVQNALSTVDQHTDDEEKQSLDSRLRLLCKQRDDAKDLKENLDRRERLVSDFLSRQLTGQQLQDYRRFVQTKASLLIRQKDVEEKQRLGEEQLEALLCSMPL
ncbi:protein Shroom1 [Aplochiton taeniatus]